MKEYGSTPWRYTPEGHGSFYIRDAMGRPLIWMGNCSSFKPGQNEAITKAICDSMNGRNELLEALEKCLDVIQPPGASVQECWKSVDEIDAAWHAGVAAIAKAKGETQ